MTMFPAFPVLFPACSQSCLVDSWCSRRSASPATITVDSMPILFPICSTTRNIGNIWNSIEKTRVCLGYPVEQVWERREQADTR